MFPSRAPGAELEQERAPPRQARLPQTLSKTARDSVSRRKRISVHRGCSSCHNQSMDCDDQEAPRSRSFLGDIPRASAVSSLPGRRVSSQRSLHVLDQLVWVRDQPM